MISESSAHEETSDRLARRAFFGFVLTFVLSRVVVFLIMGGRYWQRASVDAVIVVAALIGLVVFAPPLRRLEARNFRGFAVLVVAVVTFVVVVVMASHHIGRIVEPTLRELELNSSP